jgi:hypothetical protein
MSATFQGMQSGPLAAERQEQTIVIPANHGIETASDPKSKFKNNAPIKCTAQSSHRRFSAKTPATHVGCSDYLRCPNRRPRDGQSTVAVFDWRR